MLKTERKKTLKSLLPTGMMYGGQSRWHCAMHKKKPHLRVYTCVRNVRTNSILVLAVNTRIYVTELCHAAVVALHDRYERLLSAGLLTDRQTARPILDDQ